jgi:hypothetical protein
VERGAADIARALRDIVGHREDLLAVFVKKLVVIRKSGPVMCAGTNWLKSSL